MCGPRGATAATAVCVLLLSALAVLPAARACVYVYGGRHEVVSAIS